ncbi:MAG TPA: hypothetical protein VFT79_09150 [Solirubrobacterales bacterium]|nr:hypothetical protein [Solirubrobacterales bacterium]
MGETSKRRACIFCQATDRKINKQHVWPKWMRKVIEGGEDGMFERSRIRTKPDGTVVSQESWQEAPVDWEVSGQCEPCNSGWIEAIEQEIEPILTPMIQHQETVLGPVEQDALARWATLCVMVGQHGHPRDMRHAIAPKQYHRFYEFRELPTCQIWIARRNGEGPWPTDYMHKELFIDLIGGPETTAPNAYVAAFAVGHVAFVYWGSQFKQGPTVDIGDDLRPYLLPIWPDIEPVRWPPEGVLGPTGLKGVVRNLSSF